MAEQFLFSNNASSTLASGITAGATTIFLATGTGALFPSPAAGQRFTLTLADASGNIEVTHCTSRSVDDLTVVRAQEGTTALAFLAGDAAELRITKAVLDEFFTDTLAALKAPLASPALTGAPTAPTQPAGDNSTIIATTAFVQGEISAGRGALAYSLSGTAIPDNAVTVVPFSEEDYDTDAIHDITTNNDRLTVPSGVTKVRLTACISFATNSTGFRAMYMLKNGSSFAGQPNVNIHASTNFSKLTAPSSIIRVVGGDYFQVAVYQNSGGSLNLSATSGGNSVWFSMEIIE